MKNFIINGIVSVVISAFVVAFFYVYVPLSFLESFGKEKRVLGSTITTILSTDTLKDSRAVINTNFANLNKDKLEQGTTTGSLSVGTLTVGTLIATTSGATATSSFAAQLYAQLIAAPTFFATSTTATSTFSNGINMTGGCLFVNGLCLTSAVSSVSNSDGTLTISPTTGAVVASINPANPNAWSATQSFTGGIRFATTSPAHASGTPITLDTNGSIKYTFPDVAQGVATQAIGTTGNQIITHGLGRIPYNIEINAHSPVRFLQGSDSYCGIATSFGHATSTSGTTQSSVFSGNYFFGPGTEQIVIASTTQLRIIQFPENGAEGEIEASAQLTAMNSTTFTLNWDVNDTAAGCTTATTVRAFHWRVY